MLSVIFDLEFSNHGKETSQTDRFAAGLSQDNLMLMRGVPDR